MVSGVCAVRTGGVVYIPYIVKVFKKVLSCGNMSISPDAVIDLHLSMTGLPFKLTCVKSQLRSIYRWLLQ